VDATLLNTPLVMPPAGLHAAATEAEAARLRGLSPSAYWLEIASELAWDKPPTVGLQGTLGDFTYFAGAYGNPSVQCVDRWPADRVALRYEREDGVRETYTYGQLADDVARFAAVLQDLGVTKGDRVALYASNVPESIITIHACYRIGAVYSVIFAGFSASAVRDRIEDAEPKVVIVTDATLRRGKVIPLKQTLDEALKGLPQPHVIVARRVDNNYPLHHGEHDFAALLAQTTRKAAPVSLEANDPGFIIYTSGTTNKPKGLVHSALGFLVGAYANVKWSLDLQPSDAYWCTADVGWLTFPIFAAVGGLAHGATHIIYEGSLDTPTTSRAYDIIERYGVTKVFTAPTALRMMRRAGDELVAKAKLDTLQLVSLVGEPLDPETWHWTRDVFGGGKIFVNNTYGQTETGSAWTSTMIGATPTRPGSCGHPLPGYRGHVLRDDGTIADPCELGALVLSEPFPCLARTVYKDHARYIETYLSQFPGHYCASDAALFDQDGQLWVTGRIDDVINVAGHRLSTMEVESALVSHPKVAEAAVVGRPDDLKGQAIVAFVTPRSGVTADDALAQELRAHVTTQIGALARPEEIRFADALPKTRSGKIMRRLLREVASGSTARGDTTTLEDQGVLEKLAQSFAQDE
jgi:acetyl-CoA synthetase